MSDSETGQKKPGVPSWQLEAKKPASDAKPEPEAESNPADEDRTTAIEQAKRFLEEDEVRGASTDKKIAFLGSKGLRTEEIQGLLGISGNSEASAQTQALQPAAPASTLQPPQSQESISQVAPAPPPPPPQSQPRQPQQPQLTNPPIITYPEFLVKPASPTPLITKPRLLTTLYLFSTFTLLLHGTDTYLLKPMLQNLTASRLSLSSSALTNLQKLIAKLEPMVSTLPQPNTALLPPQDTDSESDSDPTELFHRDIGIQTSPPHSRSPSPSPPPQTPLQEQTTHLTTLKTSLATLLTNNTSQAVLNTELTTSITSLKEYLEGMTNTNLYVYGGVGVYGNYNNGKDVIDDEIQRVKMGIRSVKGVLLSARSFPGGARAR